MRHYNIWLTLGHQDMNQFLLRETQQLLINMGTQIIGRADNVDTAWNLAKQLTRVDPKKVKDTRVQYGNDPYYAHRMDSLPTPRYFALDEQDLYFTPYEQILENSYKFVDELSDLTFTVKMPKSPLQTVSLRDIERGVFIEDEDKPILAAIRDMLMKRDARKTSDVLAEIAARTAQPSQQLPAAPSQARTIPTRTKGKLP